MKKEIITYKTKTMTTRIKVNFMRNLISVSLNKTIKVGNNIVKTGKVLKKRIWKSDDVYSIRLRGRVMKNLTEQELAELLMLIN